MQRRNTVKSRIAKGKKFPIIFKNKNIPSLVGVNKPVVLAKKISENVRGQLQKKLGISLDSKSVYIKPKVMSLLYPYNERGNLSVKKYLEKVKNAKRESACHISGFDLIYFEKLLKEVKGKKDPQNLIKRLETIIERTKNAQSMGKGIIFFTIPFEKPIVKTKKFEKEKFHFKKRAAHEFFHEILENKVAKELDFRTKESLVDYLSTKFLETEFPNLSTKKRLYKAGFAWRFSPTKFGKHTRDTLKWEKILKSKTLKGALNEAVNLVNKTKTKEGKVLVNSLYNSFR
jgi:hypothetical protein